MTLHLFGIRHHGPGCARSVRAALEALDPDVVVVEGPADAEEAVSWVAHAGMQPPVALLVYPPDAPSDAAYYPLAEFSPEWQAFRWALGRQVPIRLMDLPQSHQIAWRRQMNEKLLAAAQEELEAATDDDAADSSRKAPPADAAPAAATWRTDPLALLAQAAGYRDSELWWEEQIERRQNATGLFEAVLEAMATIRAEFPDADERDVLREAHMRRTLRAVRKEGFERIAVVCGAWHAPVLTEEVLDGGRDDCRASADERRLTGLPRIKTTATWVPWTNSRLTFRSGYGAGMHSPGWYAHLWHSPVAAGMRWVATAARLLREADLDASSASIIEAVRLADALAAMRDLRAPGLEELNESMLSVFCHGEPAPLRLIRDRLEIGDVLGEVPSDAPSVPLAQDLARLQKSLRLKPSSEIRLLDLDLRNDIDRERSGLLHRLRLLDISWGAPKESQRKSSTFHEIWELAWSPDFTVGLIEASVWGNTVAAAASAKVAHDAEAATELARITALLEIALQAGLTDCIDPLLNLLQGRAAVSADVRQMMDAILPLARVARYGDVRGTDSTHVEPILAGLFERAMVGLPTACSAIDEAAAEQLLVSIGSVATALDLLDREDLRAAWFEQLWKLTAGTAHALIRGRCCRLLVESGQANDEELQRIAGLELSLANPVADCAAWASGLLRGSGFVLLNQERLWSVFDRWLTSLGPETFIELLPLLRRAFADFAPAERRQMGEKVKNLPTNRPQSRANRAADDGLDHERAAKVLPVLAHILGVSR